MKSTHKFWKDYLMGEEPGLGGKSRIEIDASKIINLGNTVRWMFGLVDRAKYDIGIFFVNDNNQKETLIPIIKNNVYTYYNNLNQNKDNNEIYYATRIYSDSFATYQIKDFNDNGYILYKVNHSVWFGSGKFHTKTIEGV